MYCPSFGVCSVVRLIRAAPPRAEPIEGPPSYDWRAPQITPPAVTAPGKVIADVVRPGHHNRDWILGCPPKRELKNCDRSRLSPRKSQPPKQNVVLEIQTTFAAFSSQDHFTYRRSRSRRHISSNAELAPHLPTQSVALSSCLPGAAPPRNRRQRTLEANQAGGFPVLKAHCRPSSGSHLDPTYFSTQT